MKAALVLIALSTVLVGTSALKCYTCINCEDNEAKVTPCSENSLVGSALAGVGLGSGKPVCTKTVVGDLVTKGCSPSDVVCGGKEELEGAGGAAYCCTGDLCNSAGSPSSALALLLSPALLALIR